MRDSLRAACRAACVALLVLAAARASAQQSDPEGRFNSGVAHLREGRIDMAIEEFRQAIKGDGKNPYFYKAYGGALMAKGEFGEAVKAFRRALELNPYYCDARTDLGLALIGSGKREEGRKELLTAFSDPTNPTPERTSYNIGQSFFEEKRYSEALDWFQTSLSKSRDDAGPYLGLSDTLFAMGRQDDGIRQLQSGVQALPSNLLLLSALGEAYYRAGRFAEARTRLEEVARKDPSGQAGLRAVELLRRFPQ